MGDSFTPNLKMQSMKTWDNKLSNKTKNAIYTKDSVIINNKESFINKLKTTQVIVNLMLSCEYLVH